MNIKEFVVRFFQFSIVITITIFFLFPYYHAGSAIFSKKNDFSTKKDASIINPLSKNPVKSDIILDEKPVTYTSDNLGINLPWLDLHNGKEVSNWLNTKYNTKLIDDDLSEIRSLGVTKVRTFCQMESIYNFSNGRFVLNELYAKNLDDYLNRAEKYGISVVCVIGDWNYNETPKDLEGFIHLDLIRTKEGQQVYKDAYISYINRFKIHKNILMWEIVNEPYASLTWSPSARELNITPQIVHAFLVQSYNTIKALAGNTFVGFSDLEEEQQSIFKLYSDPNKRKTFVDDCTDVYAMHIYRASSSEVADFSNLNDKPKWVLELGSYNYYDSDGSEHPFPAFNELYDQNENYVAVVQISRKLINSGFTLIMPWSFTSNSGMVKHNSDGSHTLYRLTQFIKDQLSHKNNNI